MPGHTAQAGDAGRPDPRPRAGSCLTGCVRATRTCPVARITRVVGTRRHGRGTAVEAARAVVD
ncbi:hypothetical protein AB0D38_41285, partial [Streptomyces sp. NPDC048279]